MASEMEGDDKAKGGAGSPVDLCAGVSFNTLIEGGIIAGRVQDEDALLVRSGDELFAIGAHCSHYHGALAGGLIVGDTLRCPLHHACFSLRSGEALRAPALDPVPCWRVELVDDIVYVREKLERPTRTLSGDAPTDIVIVGGGAAALAAAEMLRREGYGGQLTMVTAEEDAPYDRPNLSKDLLAGKMPAKWMSLRSASFYSKHDIRLLTNTRVMALDLPQRAVLLASGQRLSFDALLLATGAEPLRLEIAGAAPDRVHYLRSFADSRAIIVAAASAKRALVIGASFIGLEVAASLRLLGIEVDVVELGRVPMVNVLGAEVGKFIQALHESHGVRFHMGASVTRVDDAWAALSDGSTIEADLIIAGVGVRPALALAEQAGLAVDRGLSVDAWLQTSAAGVYAAGDIARWPDPHSGHAIRVEHWVVAQRQGQVAALNMLGRRQRFEDVPFFWSCHYELTIHYVGHAEGWDSIEIEGSLAQHDCTISYKHGERVLAVATIGRDRQSLMAARAMESARD